MLKRVQRPYAPGLNKFIASLGLVGLPSPADSIDGTHFLVFDWPHTANGTDHDRTILVVIHEDGSWDEYLGTDCLRVDEVIEKLKRMVKVT
jgi:hypothetical protein